MIQVFLVFWIVCALFIIRERQLVRMIIYLSVFSLISSVCFFLLAAPDLAMAGVVISIFSTVIYIISFEKHYSHMDQSAAEKKTSIVYFIRKYTISAIFTLFLFVLFIRFYPDNEHSAVICLKDQYLSMFPHEIGGENAVTAIYLGYRLYDTLIEALMLLVGIAAIIHLSWYGDFFSSQETYIGIKHSQIAVATIRIICPILILFSFYLVINGHISPGGGFQGGVMAASFFMCRYMIHDIYDIPIGRVLKLNKILYVGIVLMAVVFFYLIAGRHFPGYNVVYLILMNMLIGLKVTFGFYVIFFRFIAFERG